ncbi:hypothetical protein BA893_19125 [Vibrio natriegens]|uniref:hypothetical protein n=1 Tax=Vibrio natriegens TaxID=691 RepID=UPI000803C8EB|nr:hypothetical protein [Vibrio natriegens]ANQ23751.1 hypothetical protein BA893_19125 [Vibrio natriegens]
MDINKLTIETENSIKEKLSQGNRNKQSIVDEHLSAIETLSQFGVSYKQLLSSCDIPIALKHFHSMIFRAKKKQSDGQKSDATGVVKNEPGPATLPTQKPQREQQSIDVIEWKMIIPDIAEKLVREIVEHGYSIEDVKQWKASNNLPNSRALRMFFNSLKSKK